MKEFFQIFLKLDFKSLFFSPTENAFIKFFRYCFVGGIAFIVDYGVCVAIFFLMGDTRLSTVVGTTAGFVFGLIVNFILSKKFVFTEEAKTGAKGEFFCFAIIGLIGWGLSVILMFVCTEWLFSMNQYISKIIVAAIVLIYNFFARKVLLY